MMTARQPVYFISSQLQTKTMGWMIYHEWRWFITFIDNMSDTLPKRTSLRPVFLVKSLGVGRKSSQEQQGPPMYSERRGDNNKDKSHIGEHHEFYTQR